MSTVPGPRAREFMELFEASRAGDMEARGRLIEMNLGLVGAIVGRFCGPREDREDLFQVGSLGLLKALDRFDPSLGYSFSTFAFHTILGEVRRYLRDKGPVHVSRTLKERAARAKSARGRLYQQLGREPTVKEVADLLGFEESDVVMALESASPVVSLYEQAGKGTDDARYLIDLVSVPPPDVLETVALNESLESLPPIEKQVLMLRYYGELTQQQVAIRLGVSQSQVSRIERNAIVRMKQMLNEKD